MRIFLIVLLCTYLNSYLFSQNDKHKAEFLLNEAIVTMDNGDSDKAIDLLKEAKKLDPDNFIYDYETGYAYLLKEDYAASLKMYKKTIKYNYVTDQCYQMLGNLYDYNKQPQKAIKTYDKGLVRFPNSGRLYLEKGNMFWNKKQFQKALPLYEAGIKAEPSYASNYYKAATLYCNSTEEVWGMIYGEIFMNLERNSKRTEEISKLLYDTYKSQITFPTDSTASVSFSQNNTISLDALSNPETFKLPYGIGAYEPTLLLSITGHNKITISSLDSIRSKFIELYFNSNLHEKYPNVLFEYQKKLSDKGYIKAYNHWILMKGNESEFDIWYSKNQHEWNEFIEWFLENPLEISETYYFHSSQYSGQ
ncbi:MAG: tetratricopeptide repeat protein [Bacteroidales bacterium]|nr:tetratricopeptide repeat protein [Bacteroidales bacterium]MBN2819956.1 tetratricopeptide repeat protein [Bacteroidales bacterium]